MGTRNAVTAIFPAAKCFIIVADSSEPASIPAAAADSRKPADKGDFWELIV